MNDQSDIAGTIEALRRTVRVQASLLEACRDHLERECRECNLRHLETTLYDCSHLYDLECDKVGLVREADALLGDDDNLFQQLRPTQMWVHAANLCSELQRALPCANLSPRAVERLRKVLSASCEVLTGGERTRAPRLYRRSFAWPWRRHCRTVHVAHLSGGSR